MNISGIISVLLSFLFVGSANAQFIFKPKTKLDIAMNAALIGSYTTAIIDAHSTSQALSNPMRKFRESNGLYNAFIDKRCPCFQKRVLLASAYTTATNLAFFYAWQKSGNNKKLRATVITGRIIASIALIPAIRQNYRNGKF